MDIDYFSQNPWPIDTLNKTVKIWNMGLKISRPNNEKSMYTSPSDCPNPLAHSNSLDW